jgi:hypothetical protein
MYGKPEKHDARIAWIATVRQPKICLGLRALARECNLCAVATSSRHKRPNARRGFARRPDRVNDLGGGKCDLLDVDAGEIVASRSMRDRPPMLLSDCAGSRSNSTFASAQR